MGPPVLGARECTLCCFVERALVSRYYDLVSLTHSALKPGFAWSARMLSWNGAWLGIKQAPLRIEFNILPFLGKKIMVNITFNAVNLH